MKVIKKIKLHNFKKFGDFEVKLDEKLNIFIGENETGKSSILSAVNLVLSGSRSQVEKIGMEKLLNCKTIEDFLASNRRYENLPTLYVELWLNEQNNFELNGNNNSERSPSCDGLRMDCAPKDALSNEIRDILEQDDTNFPFEFYDVTFSTFGGTQYSGYKRYLKHMVIDTALIGNDYAVREYVKDMYEIHATSSEKHKHQNEYRKAKENFKNVVLSDLNGRVQDCSFALKNDTKTNLQTDLTLIQNNISIDNRGTGEQCFIKTKFALGRNEAGQTKIDIALIEEPENHLSHINMKRLIRMIDASNDKQLLIATHSNMISSRLDLRKTILLHTTSCDPALLKDLSEETAKFFIKAPDHGILNFVLSKKVILIEGDSEHILLEKFYEKQTNKKPEEHDVHVLSVGGTSFKRYLDIARLLGIKVAVIRDNDGDYQSNCVDAYQEYQNDQTSVFADTDNERCTFEVCIYNDNKNKCDNLFVSGRRTLSVQDYMLKNKTDAAFALLEQGGDLAIPSYIRSAIEWISA